MNAYMPFAAAVMTDLAELSYGAVMVLVAPEQPSSIEPATSTLVRFPNYLYLAFDDA